MARNREKNRAKKKQEQMLERNNEFGKLDLTPYEAIREIIKNDKRKEKSHEQILNVDCRSC